MQSFSDFLPKKTKEELAESNFQVGAVLKYHVTFTTPPKEKILVIVGFDKEKVLFASVLVNSEINPNKFPTEDLKNLHLELDSTNREYLDHTSFVDCSEIFSQSIEAVKKQLAESPEIHKGEMDTADLKNVIDKIRGAKTIPPKIKKQFGFI